MALNVCKVHVNWLQGDPQFINENIQVCVLNL